jgi:hypothetical protein
MSGRNRGTRASAALLAAGILLLASAAAAQTVGRVAALAGQARAVGPAGSRALACGDAVGAGDRLELGPGARLGVLSDAVYAQLTAGSRATAGVTADGLPDWSLESGRLRLVDTRDPGEAGRSRLATPHAVARGLAGDSEAYVLVEKTGAYSIVCEWGEPLAVSRADEALTAGPGECAVAKPSEPLYKADAQAERIPLAGGDACGLGPLDGGDLAARFGDPLAAVAAGPPPGGLLPPAPPAFARQPCDNPGSGCAGGPGLLGIGVVESPTGTGSLPGVP